MVFECQSLLGFRLGAWHHKWIFILYLVVKAKLATKYKLVKWGIIYLKDALLSVGKWGTWSHLFQCAYATEVWNNILNLQGIRRRAWTGQLKYSRETNSWKERVVQLLYIEWKWLIQYINYGWNVIVGSSNRSNNRSIIKHIVLEIHGRGNRHPKGETRLCDLNNFS